MPRKENQKAKLLYLLSYFKKYSDEQHLVTVPQLEEALDRAQIPCERKSIYSDIEALRTAGYDIELQRGRGGGYYLAQRTFELSELKILVDAVQSSLFLSEPKSNGLIKKIMSLASHAQSEQLRRQVYVSGRIKSMSSSCIYSVDAIYSAIATSQMISFQYQTYSLGKKRILRRTKPYQVSPWALAWENNAYYLIAYQDEHEPIGIRHYRVDKMVNVATLDEERHGKKAFEQFDVPSYLQKTFGMYHGYDARVTLRCKNGLVGAMIDRFGVVPIFVPDENGTHFHFDTTISVSPQFFGWVCGFGGDVEITAPEAVRTEFAQFAQDILAHYQDV